MLFVYNESKNPWGVMRLHKNNVVRFVKTQTVPAYGGKPEKRLAMSIIGSEKLFPSFQSTEAVFSSAVETEHPLQLSAKSTNVIFNRKAFQPFIVDHDHIQKFVLLGTLDMSGKKLKSVSTQKSFMLEYLLFGGEFSFVVSFNEENSTFSVDLWNPKDKKVYTHTFTRAKGSIIHQVTSAPGTWDEKQRLRLKKFRPSYTTHYVLVHPKDKEALMGILKQNKHEVIEIEKRTFDSVVKSLKEQNVRAVTLFANTPMTPIDPDQFTRYKSVSNSLADHFNTVFKLYNDNRIFKVKIN